MAHAIYEALSKGAIEPGFLQFWARYLTFQDFPGEAWFGENMIVWAWNHLWYLPYLLLCTLLLIPVIEPLLDLSATRGDAVCKLSRSRAGLTANARVARAPLLAVSRS